MRLREVGLYAALGWLILVLQSTVIGYTGRGVLQPDMLLVILVFVGLHRNGMGGACLALFYGYLTDVFSGRPFGTYLFVYACLFFVVRLLSLRLLLHSRWTQMALVAVLSSLVSGSAVALHALVARPALPEYLVRDLVARVGSGALFVWVLFPLLSRLEAPIAPRSETLNISV